MEKKLVEKANALLEEIKGLNDYKYLLSKRGSSALHFEIRLHYGQLNDYGIVKIDTKHNKLLFEVVDNIILKLQKELDNL